MKTRTYQARELKDALAQIRQELGPDALIVKTRQVTPLLGLGRPLLEVTAALPPSHEEPTPMLAHGAEGGRRTVSWRRGGAKKRAAAPQAERSSGGEESAWFRQGEAAARDGDVAGSQQRAEDAAETALEARLLPLQRELRTLRAQLQQVTQRGTPALRQEVEELRAVLHTMSQGYEAAGGVSAEVAQLINLGIERARAEQVIQRARHLHGDREGDISEALRKALAERVVAAGPVGVSARVAAFIGPTGVGKTTTIAKIAARAALMDGARVALITIDTFRVGAIDQLQRYADLMELPLHVAGTSAALRAAVRSNANADLLLVDTAGRGPRDVAQLAALREVLGINEPLEVHLCLAATTRAREQALAVQSYRPLRPTRLCVTKLDEAIGLGEVLNLHESSKLPISYFGTGQRVPEDLDLCTAEGYVDWLLRTPPAPPSAGAVFTAGVDDDASQASEAGGSRGEVLLA